MVNNKKGVDFEMVRSSIDAPTIKYLEAFDKYIRDFEKLDPETQRIKSKESLIRSGILTKKGTEKRIIVTRK